MGWFQSQKAGGAGSSSKSPSDAISPQRGHHVRPNAAAGMSPERPRDSIDFRMTGLGGEIRECLEKRFFRTTSGIKPELRRARRNIDLLIQHVIAGTPKSAVPLLRQRLPMQIIGGGRSF